MRNSVDITEGIPKEATLSLCRGCERFLSPPQSWVYAQPESRELLGEHKSRINRADVAALCLKKITRPLMKVRLIDASFIWTEPHSRRVKIKVTIQKEVLANTVLATDFCPHIGGAYRTVSIMYKAGGEEYMESDGTSAPKGDT